MNRFSLLTLILFAFLFSVQADDANNALVDKRMLQNVCAFKAPSIQETQTIEEQEYVIVSYVGFQRKPQRLIQTRDWGPNNIKWRIKSDKTGEIAVTGFAKLPEKDEDLYNGKFSTVSGPCLIAWKIDDITIDNKKYDLYTINPVKAKDTLNNRSATKRIKNNILKTKQKKADKDKKNKKNHKDDHDEQDNQDKKQANHDEHDNKD